MFHWLTCMLNMNPCLRQFFADPPRWFRWKSLNVHPSKCLPSYCCSLRSKPTSVQKINTTSFWFDLLNSFCTIQLNQRFPVCSKSNAIHIKFVWICQKTGILKLILAKGNITFYQVVSSHLQAKVIVNEIILYFCDNMRRSMKCTLRLKIIQSKTMKSL